MTATGRPHYTHFPDRNSPKTFGESGFVLVPHVKADFSRERLK